MENPIKPTIKTELFPIILIIITLVSSFYFYSVFPDEVPMHWNAAGEIDRYGSKLQGAILMPLVILGMYLLFLVLPLADPKKARYDQFRKIYHVFKTYLILFMVLMYWVTGLNAIGYNISVAFWIPFMVGLLFIIIGNYMSKIKPNWFMGIRTPWTMSSEEVWNKTHRLGGKLFMGGGVVLMLMNFFPAAWRMPLLIVDVIVLVLGTVLYSLYLYLKEQKTKKHGTNNESAKPENYKSS